MKNESAGRRAAVYWFVDGLPDILFGAMLLVFAAVGFVWRVYSPHRWVYDFWLMALGFLLFSWKERAVLTFLKSRVTYPRTGYAQAPDEAPASNGLTTLSITAGPPENENVTYFSRRTVMIVFFLVYLSFSNNPPPRWLAPILMVALAIALYAANRASERPFRWWSTLILALTGLVFVWGDLPPLLQPLLSMLLTGGWLVAQGMCTLVRYLRANPDPAAAGALRA